MAKVQSFGDKVAKAQRQAKKCPVCGSPLSYMKVISPLATETGAFRFRTRVSRVCKCTEAELKVS